LPGIAYNPLIPVFDRFARGFPQHAEGEPATYGPFSEACGTTFAWDAHFSAYAQPQIARRLAGQAALAYRPKMVLFVVDVDGPDHRWTPEWWALEKVKVQTLFRDHGRGYAYTTRGGYRIVMGLAEELVLATPADYARWRASYEDWIAGIKSRYGIECDEHCADAFRLFRLPRVARDGVPQEPIEEIGRADSMLAWREPYVAADDPRVLRPAAAPVEIARPAPVNEERLVEAAKSLAAVWPKRGRHHASLALCGALAKAGWSDDAIADFVTGVAGAAAGDDGDHTKRLAQARQSAEKVARGEEVAGWYSLEQLLAGALDAPPAEVIQSALLGAQRSMGMGPAIDLFSKAIAAAQPPTLKQQLDASCAELGGDESFRALLDEVAEALVPRVESAESKSTNRDTRPMGVRGREMRARAHEQPKMLVEGLVPASGIGAVSGEPKAGKSWDLTHLSVCCASGKPVFGKYAVPEPFAVFYLYLEDQEDSVNNRREAIAVGMGLDPGGAWLDNWYAQARGRALDVMDMASLITLAASVLRFEREDGKKIKLLIIDPLSNAHSGEEDKRDSMRVVMARLHALEEYLKLSIAFAHHSKKMSADNKGQKRGGQNMRGSSVIHAAVDYGIYFSHLRGDSKNEFIARVESEVKAARGGGIFDRKIVIEDNDRGNAIKATYTWSEPETESEARSPSKGGAEAAQERAVAVTQRLFDHGGPMSVEELKRSVSGGHDLVSKALAIAVELGWAERMMHGGAMRGHVITEAGKAFIRSGDPAPAAPDRSPPGVPAGAVAGLIGELVRDARGA
jgi:hypothetical protein